MPTKPQREGHETRQREASGGFPAAFDVLLSCRGRRGSPTTVSRSPRPLRTESISIGGGFGGGSPDGPPSSGLDGEGSVGEGTVAPLGCVGS